MAEPNIHQLLARYKTVIDADITAYTRHAEQAAASQYGQEAAAASTAFFDLVRSRDDRVCGSMVMVGYEMLGGTDGRMVVRAATALEILRTYIRVLADPAASTDVRNAALAGAHAAQMLLAGLTVDDSLVRKVLGIVNLTMVVASQGNRLSNVLDTTKEVHVTDVDNWLQWAVAEPMFLNPLCVGMVLTGAGCDDTNAIREYALAAGKAYGLSVPGLAATVSAAMPAYDRTVARIAAARMALASLDAVDRPWNTGERALLQSITAVLSRTPTPVQQLTLSR